MKKARKYDSEPDNGILTIRLFQEDRSSPSIVFKITLNPQLPNAKTNTFKAAIDW